MKHNEYLLVCPSYPPPLSGGHKVWTYNMVENGSLSFDILTSSLKKGWDEMSSPRHNMIRKPIIFSGKSEDIDPSALRLLVSYAYLGLYMVWCRFARHYRGVIVHGFVFLNGLYFLLGRFLRVPVIGMGNTEEYTLALHGKGAGNAFKRWWLRTTHPLATGHVVVCHFCRDILVDQGLKRERIEVVPSSINPEKLRSSTRKKEHGHRVLSVGRLIERKGFHKLIDAVNQLLPELPAIQLDIVGKGRMREKLEAKVEGYGIQNSVHIHGGLSDSELNRLYAESDLFVLAHMMLENGDTEGCPTTFSEASGNGLPVIGGTGAGASTAIVNGKTGFIVNCRDVDLLASRIKEILTNPDLARRMGDAGVEKIRTGHVPAVTGPAFSSAIMKFAGMF